MAEIEKRKRGRPRKPDAKRNEYHLRMTDEELRKLQHICNAEGKTMSEVLIKGINSQYNMSKFGDF